MFPFACSARWACVLVKAAIHWIACDFPLLCTGTARSEPPRKPGIGLPGVWLGITNCAVAPLYFFPVQHVYHAGP
jgi:hypothetical protein